MLKAKFLALPPEAQEFVCDFLKECADAPKSINLKTSSINLFRFMEIQGLRNALESYRFESIVDALFTESPNPSSSQVDEK